MKRKSEWRLEMDDGGAFIIFNDGSDADEAFTVYLPVNPQRWEAAIKVIIDALNKSGIRP